MTNLYDANFDDELNCNEDYQIIIGYNNSCDTCKRLACMLQMKRIKYAKIDMTQNRKFLENLKIIQESIHISVPAILIYKDNKFVKKINPTLDTQEILNARNC